MRRLLSGVLIIIVVVVVLIATLTRGDGTVVHEIIDGDTLDVRTGTEVTRVRLLNVNTPELGSECLAEEARDFLAEALPVGTPVTLEYDQERTDRYDRTLAGVVHEGTFINAAIAEAGLGLAVIYEPNDRFYDQVHAGQVRAEAKGIGLSQMPLSCLVAGDYESDVLSRAESTVASGSPAEVIELRILLDRLADGSVEQTTMQEQATEAFGTHYEQRWAELSAAVEERVAALGLSEPAAG